ncbi:hypothetical protein AVEN_178833-1 [Araneus ventricosus]|uniref:Uncharacterized protein n=1 Tax=Araneus ventricosus TaxID=182803 RepID=A0A4Y2BEC8_ARAVE|nr:hypothetical protein AVEN_178833-1 [Araneus ventricosus]
MWDLCLPPDGAATPTDTLNVTEDRVRREQLTARGGQTEGLSYALVRCDSIVNSPTLDSISLFITKPVTIAPVHIPSSSVNIVQNKRTCYFKRGEWYYFKTITPILIPDLIPPKSHLVRPSTTLEKRYFLPYAFAF